MAGWQILAARDINSDGMKAYSLEGRVALVTGGGRRIGREIALTLGHAGASVVVNYRRSKSLALSTVREIRRLGVEAMAIRADVARPREVRAMFLAARKRFGRLDVLVNNAGVFFPAKWDKLTERDWDRALGINLKGAFFCAQAAGRIMTRQKRGCIINISSLGGLKAWPDYTHYCASKAGNIMLTRCLAKALAPYVQVNSIAPGTILFPDERPSALIRRVIASTPLQRPGRPEEIADLVLYLAAQGGFITGQIFTVDGGQSLS